jgi:cytochrome c biogenesis protein CcmG/thiol:disulfide interchange protein DsbE
VTDLQIGYPHVLDPDGALLTELGVRGLPVTLGLDEERRIAARSSASWTLESSSS